MLFTVTLRHLSADGKNVGADIPNSQLYHVSPKQLHTLLKGLGDNAPSVVPPAEPEVRISGPSGEFVVRVNSGQLQLVSWSSAHKGGTATPAQIVATITGEEKVEPVRSVARPTASPAAARSSSPVREKITLVLLGVAILAVNGFTAWIWTRPPRSLLPNYRVLGPEQAERVLASVAGTYETGRDSGDRRIEIKKDASVQRFKLGTGGAVKETQNFTVQPVETDGKTGLLTSRKSMITVKDNLSLVLFGDTYTRVPN